MMLPLTMLPKHMAKSLKGAKWRSQIVQAFCFVDAGGSDKVHDFIFDEQVVLNTSVRHEAQRRIRELLGKPHGWESFVLRLFHQYCHFAGAPGSMLALHYMKGGKGKKRTGTLINKPGRLSDEEARAKQRHLLTGRPVSYRRRPVDLADEKNMVDALTRYWAKQRLSMTEAYVRLVDEHYAGAKECDIPTCDTFRYHAKRLIPELDLLRLRNRQAIHEQYHAARTGTSTDYTQGRIEIADLDGFVPKVGIEVRVKGKVVATHLKVIFAVSRNSHAVLSAEVVLRGETAEAYRRAVAGIYLDKSELAAQLSLDTTDGLLHGTIDGIFVDNGAGAAKENAQVACAEMRLCLEIAPPGRGDYKAVVENINSLMVRFMQSWPSGYSRQSDKVQKDQRRNARRSRPLPFNRFVKLLWMAIQHHNLTADRSYLRDQAMLKNGDGGSPAELWKHAQAQRRGDAARLLTPREVFSRFVPWKRYKVRKGLVHYKNKLRYTSPELEELWNAHVKIPEKGRGACTVRVKRLDGTLHAIVWRRNDGQEGLLRLIEQDERRVGSLSWGEYNLTLEADSMRELEESKKRLAGRSRLNAEQNALVAAAEQTRISNGDWRDLAGKTVGEAKAANAAAADRGRGRKEAQARGLVDETLSVVPAATAGAAQLDTAESYAARVRARRASRSML
ncbi:hypothetical protein [Caballeronia grimmiae]|uniref:hypothetical protein n=1 Tax=Caballeronia grimmiae TaxID=1071679 RepID=UPI0038B8AB35